MSGLLISLDTQSEPTMVNDYLVDFCARWSTNHEVIVFQVLQAQRKSPV